jgi:putative solute:sodium symporter small subunit
LRTWPTFITMPDPSTSTRERLQYWRRTRQFTMTLLAIWFVATFGIIWFARELSAISFFGWPLSFYLVAQGAVLLYTLLIGIHTYYMGKLDRDVKTQHDVD